MLAFLDEEAATHRCGHPIDECMDEANANRYRGAAYVCFACAAAARKEDADRKSEVPLHGRSWHAIDRAQER